MVDTELTDLTEDLTPGTDSLLYTVDNPAGTPTDRKATLANLLGTGLAAIRGLTSAANKIVRFTGSGTADLLDFVDEDNMASDSATALPSQQSVKAYADARQTAAEATAASALSTHEGAADPHIGYQLEPVEGAFVDGDKTKLDNISVTQAVDLDTIETRVNELDAAVVLQGSWDASVGTFPGGGTAQAGHSYIVSVGGTVDGVEFVANDRIVAIVDNASTATYASNWLKLDYTDAVLSVVGQTGAVTIGQIFTALKTVDGTGSGLDADLLDGAERTVFTENADTSVAANAWVIDEDDMVSNSATKVPVQQSVKAYVDALPEIVSGTDITVDAPSGGQQAVNVDPVSAALWTPLSKIADADETIDTSTITHKDGSDPGYAGNIALVFDDTELAVSAVYEVTALIYYNSGNTPDFKAAFAGDTGVTFAWQDEVNIIGNAFRVKRAIGNTSAWPGQGTDLAALAKGIMTTPASFTGGDVFWFRWAQNTSDAGDTTRLADSALILRRLS